MLSGVLTALVTPMLASKIDEKSFRKLLKTQIGSGVSGVIVAGTTGESPVLSDDEFKLLIEVALGEVGDKIKVFAGVGSCDTVKAAAKTKLAHNLGVDGMLAVTPYYNKPTQSGLIEYYDKIADSTDKPIILYSVPSRTGVEIAVNSAKILHKKHKNIVAIKEASENCGRVEQLANLFNENFSVLSGNDSMTLPFMSLGATGVVSVVSNVKPREMSEVISLALAGNFKEALKKYRPLIQIIKNLFIETNPLPIKYALEKYGIISSSECRSPLGHLQDSSRAILSSLF